MKHTKGPWKWMYWQCDGQIVYNVKPVMRPMDGQIENEADARLIAAAPELLDALETVRKAYPNMVTEIISVVDAAIAKAKE